MNTDHIKTFLAVYRAQSFVAVAKDRNVSPSSITRAVATLESNLSTRLFQRSTRTVTPTDAGDAYYKRVAPIIEALDDTHETLAQRTSGPSGRLRVTASVSYGQIMITPKLSAFQERFPDIELELILSDSRVDIISDQIDVAIRLGRLPDSALTAKKLSDVSYKLVASPDYLSSRDKVVTPQDLRHHDLITFTYSDFRYEWTFEKRNVTHAIPIIPCMTISNAVAIQHCIRDGMGIALLADWTVADDLETGRLVEVLPQWQGSGATQDSSVWIVYPSSRFVPAKTRAFVEFISE